MMDSFRRVSTWWGHGGSDRGRREHSCPGCEPMETRALMANAPLAALLPAANPPAAVGPTTVVITPASNPKLIAALNTFLYDLETALHLPAGPGADAAFAAVKADLALITGLANSTDARAVTRLNNDVTTIVQTGSITPVQRLSLISDLESILVGAGVPGSAVVSAANQALAPLHATSPVDDSLSHQLADPNALGTPLAGSTRGQDAPPSTAISAGGSSSGDALPESGLLGKSFRTLMDDLRGILGKSKAVSPAEKSAVRSDFAAVAMMSHRPDAATVALLRQDLDAIVTDGHITADGRSKITNDLGAMLQSAGVPNRLAGRVMTDLAPILQAEDLAPTDLRTLLGDLVNLLIARPRLSNRS